MTEVNSAGSSVSSIKYYISSLLYENGMGEDDALKGYARLLESLTKYHSGTDDSELKDLIQRSIETIREICSDEKNHRLHLMALENDFDSIEITPDGMPAVLENIVNMVGNSE